jgi:hypothetical protein
MLVPVLVFLVCFCVGVIAAARWLPDLAAGPVGGLAFFAVVGLFAAALSIAGLVAYTTIAEITNPPNRIGVDKAEILAGGIRNVLLDSGTISGLTGIVYLLAPAPDEDEYIGESQTTAGQET